MGFLSPLVFLGLATLAVPVIIHMIQRERKDVVEFPSLMFIRKIPFHSFRRQRIRHWFLLSLRCLAIALLLAAFARPFFRAPALAAVTSGAREVVILLDRSYSMAYGDRWDRAKTAARDVMATLAPDDLATVILFDSGLESSPPLDDGSCHAERSHRGRGAGGGDDALRSRPEARGERPSRAPTCPASRRCSSATSSGWAWTARRASASPPGRC